MALAFYRKIKRLFCVKKRGSSKTFLRIYSKYVAKFTFGRIASCVQVQKGWIHKGSGNFDTNWSQL